MVNTSRGLAHLFPHHCIPDTTFWGYPVYISCKKSKHYTIGKGGGGYSRLGTTTLAQQGQTGMHCHCCHFHSTTSSLCRAISVPAKKYLKILCGDYRHGTVIILRWTKEGTTIRLWRDREDGDRQSCQLELTVVVIEMQQALQSSAPLSHSGW